MNKILLIAVIGAFFACSTDNLPTDGEMVPLLSPGMQLEPYDDGSGLIRVTAYDGAGNTLEQGDYLNDLRQGVYTEFHTNGLVKSVTGYVNGKKQGQTILINDKGQLEERSTYHNGVLNGAYIKYNRIRVRESRNYVDGKIHGLVEKFYPSNRIMERSNYNSGQFDGISRWFDQNGNNTIAYEYKMGELVGEVDLLVNPVPTN